MATRPMSEVIQHLRNPLVLRDEAELTDGQLLECFISRRDSAALAALVRRHGPMVWGVCRRVLRSYHDAEDAFQATFLVLVCKATSIASRELLANWLYGVAYRTALNARAAAAKRRARERQVVQMPEPAVAEENLWHDLQPLLDQELSRLPDKYRVVIVLCDLEGKTRKEAAQQIGCPEGTVAGRLARARTFLAKRLARHGVAISAGSLAAILSENAPACVPISVVWSTIKAASLFAVGRAATVGVISVKVAALTEGVMKTMFLTKLKIATAVMLMAGILGGGWFASLALSEAPVEVKPADAKKGAAPGPAPKAEKPPKEILEKAAGAADDVKDDAQKAFVLMTIATAQAKVGDQPAARKSFQQAVRAAEAIQDDRYRKGTTLMFIAEAQAGAGEVEAALKTAEGIQTEGINCKEWALAQIASAQAKAKNVEGALKTVESIPDSGKSLALMLVASCLAGAGDFKQALTLVREMQDESYKVEALTKIAEAQFLAGERDPAKNVIDSARKIADGMEDSNPDMNTSRKARAQMLVALAQIASGDEKAGLKRAGDFKGSHLRDMILADVAIRRAKAGNVKEASQALDDIQDGVQKAAVLRAVAAAQARAGDFKASRQATDAIEYVREKAEALLDMAAVRLTSGDQAAAADLYREAIQALKTLDILWYDGGPMCATPSHLHRIVSAWAEAGDAKSALAWVEKQQSAFVKAIGLAGIAEGIGKRLDQEKRPADKK